MHKIERLLQTLAPKGVEFKKIGELFKRNKGINITATQMKELHSEIGKVRIFAGGATKADINYKDISKKDIINCESVIIKSRGNIGFEYYNQPFSHKNEIWSYSSKTNQMLVKFLYYYLSNNQDYFQKLAQSSSVKLPQLSVSDTDEYEVPVPPLEIQQEIVKILDAFTELNTELNVRKKQYQYYQNMLLDFKDIHQNHKDAKEKLAQKTYPKRLKTLLQTLAPKGVEFKTLEEVFEIKNGYTPSKNNPEFWKNGTIPWFRMEDIRENGRILKDSIQHITPKALKGKKLFPKNSIIISTTATIGEHALLIVDSLANQRFTFLSKKANCDLALDMKFFFYQCFLLGEWCKNNINVSGFASVDMSTFKKYKFPIPPLEIQQEIVKILDQFSILTTDLLAGIPAEIKARKKQYEYYREKLLAFKPLQNKE
ncbi:restriction endonuclease subunit S [Helicobacter pylori]|uniref:restriction endonuclease subunit S n=1 Tax=Helicobacter pylori TaxID=210 RepID=UPI000FDDBCA3|nr:restriction endonuclease subunit S [Helicobacter pylori]RVY38836.1 restriction endonuclease subunit S [Helicobacter pylori]RVY88861.1 restriction endonuclease subunit S [Helicobacter pylori]